MGYLLLAGEAKFGEHMSEPDLHAIGRQAGLMLPFALSPQRLHLIKITNTREIPESAGFKVSVQKTYLLSM